jgi:hypothetical protein
VGRHAAAAGADVDPIVAAALSRRPTTAGPSEPRHGAELGVRGLTAADGEGGLGWPGEPGNGTGLGWPVDQVPGTTVSGERTGVAVVPGATPARRRSGWRRLFGGGSSAERGSSAA